MRGVYTHACSKKEQKGMNEKERKSRESVGWGVGAYALGVFLVLFG